MKTKHTPGPYEAEHDGDRGRGAWIGNKAGEWLCLTCGTTDEVARANTAFMLRACNAHDDLFAMLSEAATQIEYMQERFAKTGTGAAVASRCRALLAKVEASA